MTVTAPKGFAQYFDEATSSLVNETRQAVMNCIENPGLDLSTLIIAHRLTTVGKCDQIVELSHGRVVAQGTYDELMELVTVRK